MNPIWSWTKAWVLQPSYFPAWLSAISACVALFISVWAVLRSGSVERRRDRLRARGIAVAIYPEILKLQVTLQDTAAALRILLSGESGLHGQAIAASVQLSGRVEVPPMLDRNLDTLYLLGDVAGPACLQLVSVLVQYNALVEKISARIATLDAEHWREALFHLQEHLALLSKLNEKCKAEVQEVHDRVRE